MKRLLTLLPLLLVAACTLPVTSSDVACPSVGILPQAEKIAFFKDHAAPADKMVSARFGGYRGGCALKDGRLQFALDVDFNGERGKDAPPQDEQTLSYFVAVIDAKENILQRDAFNTTLLFNEAGIGRAKEKHDINLPLDPSLTDKQAALKSAQDNLRVVMGFVLTPEQLDYNNGKFLTGANKAAEENAAPPAPKQRPAKPVIKVKQKPKPQPMTKPATKPKT